MPVDVLLRALTNGLDGRAPAGSEAAMGDSFNRPMAHPLRGHQSINRRPGRPQLCLVRKFDARRQQTARPQRQEPTDPAPVIKVRPHEEITVADPDRLRLLSTPLYELALAVDGETIAPKNEAPKDGGDDDPRFIGADGIGVELGLPGWRSSRRTPSDLVLPLAASSGGLRRGPGRESFVGEAVFLALGG